MASAAIPVLIKTAADFFLNQTIRAIDRESHKYKATYTARTSDYLLERQNENKGKLHFAGFRFTRFAGVQMSNGCRTDTSVLPALEFEADIDVSLPLNVMRIKPTRFVMNKSKAKVASANGNLDVNIQVSLSGIAATKDGDKFIDIARIDFPIGTVNLDNAIVLNENSLDNLTSGWFVLPAFRQPPTNQEFAPIVLTVTVMEADEFGDILAKGASKLSDQREKILAELIKLLNQDPK